MTTTPNPSFDLDALRATQKARGEKHLWRGLEDLADTAEHRAFLEHEFPNDPEKDASAAPADANDGVHRRDVLKWMAASAALAGLAGCTKMPEQKIVPYVRPPEEIIPGKPLFYATSMTMGGVATGILVESNMGRPTKVEGNPLHPGSLGATDIFAQAHVLGLYDPDRSQTVIHEGRISTWGTFVAEVNDLRNNFAVTKGKGLRILTETITSPSLAAQIQELLKEFPEAKWHQWEPCSRDNVREGAKMAFGRYVNTVYRFDKADVILSLDADFLYSGPGAVRYARDFATRRNVEGPGAKMNRLYVVEPGATTTGAMADHRLAMRASDIPDFARDLAIALRVPLQGSASVRSNVNSLFRTQWIDALAKDLEKHRGSCAIIAGDQQPAIVHALAHAINSALGAVGQSVIYTEPIEANPTTKFESPDGVFYGDVQALFIIGANPVYADPRDPVSISFRRELLKVPFRSHLGLYDDETAELCHWHIPAAHELESWSDARAYDGTVGIIQPLIAPLYDGKTAHELMAALSGHADKTSYDVVREYWKSRKGDKNFEPFWATSLHDGLIRDSALPALPVTVDASLHTVRSPDYVAAFPSAPPPTSLELVIRPDPTVFDGRFANNGWLQEAPKPITKLTWDNTAQVSPATAQRLGLTNGEVVEVAWRDRSIEAPVWIVPGAADDSVTIHLGYGRRKAGRIGTGIGFDAYALLERYSFISVAAWGFDGAKDPQIIKTGKKYKLAATQHHNIIDVNGHPEEMESREAFKRDLVRIGTLDEFNKNPKFAQDEPEPEPPKELSLYPGFKYEGYAWGMAIDLNKCVGCGACVLACQAENNIPVVGKEEVIAGREMHWIRVDTYFRGDVDTPETYFEPVPCMHCENAPCEGVCPVAATVHSPEGLNEMIYNRCVGTRYCSNNCPYKVRRFNFKLFSDYTTESLMSLRNPNVTVRSRGVMEKCSYCVQRIQSAKIEAEKQDRSVRDGDIVTACEAVCPAQAIVFGNINDKNSRVAKLKASTRDYSLLAELNTRPRTTYQARLRNPNPAMPGAGKE